jgi:HEPN domain-containing protein
MNVDDPIAWINLAEEDWQLAKSLLRRKRPSPTHICFHAQQSAEKYLKALLISAHVSFPKTHDLGTLNTLCEKAGIKTNLSMEDLDLLSDFAVSSRYPGALVSLEDAKQALVIAQAVRTFVRRYFSL